MALPSFPRSISSLPRPFLHLLLLIIPLAPLSHFLGADYVQLYLILSLLLLLFLNLGHRTSGPSAYSVFNPNQTSLPGQLHASHFESEILHRPHISSIPDSTASILASIRRETSRNARRPPLRRATR